MECITPDQWMTNPEKFQSDLNSCWEEVPEFGFTRAHGFKDKQLVRFRGMIQDMADPVIYLTQYEVMNKKTGQKEKRFGKYKDIITCNDDEILIYDSDFSKNGDRRAYYCISVPGINQWTTFNMQKNNSCEMETSSCSDCKRKYDEVDGNATEEIEPSSDKRQCRQHSNSERDEESRGVHLNFPIEDQNNYSCVLNVYDELDCSLRLNQVIDCVGFIYLTECCDELEHLPSTLVPRLHVVSFKQISSPNPYLNLPLPKSDIILRADKTRSDLVLALTQLMLGDSLAAEYLLCNLVSKIFTRRDVVLGKFSVNLSNIPCGENYVLNVYKIIQNLIPKSHYLPLSLAKMNSDSFVPKKDFENNFLKTGTLQLSDNTHLFIDETHLEAGKLEENGVLNVQALGNLISNQIVDFDFKYHKLDIEVDIPIVIMSDGKSLLPNDFHIVLKPADNCLNSLEENFEAVKTYLSEPLMNEVRQYLSVVPHSEFDLSEELLQVVQEDYVKLRQTETKANEFDLHNLLVLARLLSFTFGKDHLTKEIWDKAYSMETERRRRLTLD